MSCPHQAEVLLLDTEWTSPADAERLRTHARGCPHCAPSLARLEEARAALARAHGTSPTEHERRQMRAWLAEATPERARAPSRWALALALPVAAAAALLLVQRPPTPSWSIEQGEAVAEERRLGAGAALPAGPVVGLGNEARVLLPGARLRALELTSCALAALTPRPVLRLEQGEAELELAAARIVEVRTPELVVVAVGARFRVGAAGGRSWAELQAGELRAGPPGAELRALTVGQRIEAGRGPLAARSAENTGSAAGAPSPEVAPAGGSSVQAASDFVQTASEDGTAAPTGSGGGPGSPAAIEPARQPGADGAAVHADSEAERRRAARAGGEPGSRGAAVPADARDERGSRSARARIARSLRQTEPAGAQASRAEDEVERLLAQADEARVRGAYRAAAELYRRVAGHAQGGPYAEEASLRAALCLEQQARPEEALELLGALRARFPVGELGPERLGLEISLLRALDRAPEAAARLEASRYTEGPELRAERLAVAQALAERAPARARRLLEPLLGREGAEGARARQLAGLLENER